MLGTVIWDAYAREDAPGMAAALDFVCPPDSSGPFAASGLYAFWDPQTRDLLYIGRTNDLGVRFRQHNGLMRCLARVCKVREVRAYFESGAELLGFTAYPQAPIDQPDSARARRPYPDDLEARVMFADLALPGQEELARAEGQLIGAYRNRHGVLPPWNRIGGDSSAAAKATTDTEPLLDIFRARYRCALNARRLLREIASDDDALIWEPLLHLARFNMVAWGGAIGDDLFRAELERLAAGPEWTGSTEYRRLLESGYLESRRRPRSA